VLYKDVNMRVIAKRTLREFWEQHADAEQSLKAWYQDAAQATWTSPQDIRQTYATASIVANNRVVFNIRGNQYRLVVAINYAFGIVYIRFVGTHAEYTMQRLRRSMSCGRQRRIHLKAIS
jgi:mRNA interferase HigB